MTPLRFTRIEPPPPRGCACDRAPAVQLRAFCGRCRIIRKLPACVLCGDRGWTVRDMRWVRCTHG
jgi:hypothetical protein